MSMKYGCCGSADSGEGRRVEVADKNPEDYPYTAVLDIKGDDLRKTACGMWKMH